MKQYDIAIVYRIYPAVSKVPPIYSDDKFNLSKLCLKSFANSLKNLKPYIWILLDGCPIEYEELFREELEGFDFQILNLNSMGNQKTFSKQMDILLEQEKSDYVYFAEDDYFYFEDAFQKMLEAIKHPKVDFLSPYDHPDTRNYILHNYTKHKIQAAKHTWLSVGTTTMTFMTTKQKLVECENTFRTYTKNNYDNAMWMSLTGKNIFNISLPFRGLFNDIQLTKIFVKLYKYNFIQTLFGKRYNLYQPVPTLSTHMDNQCLPEYINWKKEFEKYDS